MKDHNADIHSGIAWAIIMSLGAVIMSICSLARSNPRGIGVDYLGIIVGILALLVTLLVGWQIYTTIAAKQAIEEFKAEVRDSIADIKQYQTSHKKLLAVIAQMPKQPQKSNQKIYVQLLDYLLSTLSLTGRSSDYTLLLIGMLEKTLKNMEKKGESFDADVSKKCTSLYNKILQRENELTSLEREQLHDLYKCRTALKPKPKK